MKKYLYFCTLIFVALNTMAQTESYNHDGRDGSFCTTLEKELTFQYSSNQIPVADGWIYDDVYSDEFDGASVDTSKWTRQHRYVHENNTKVGCIKENANVSNGKLVLSAYYSPDGINMLMNDDTLSIHYVTGSVISKKQIRYGYYEVECYLPRNHNLRPCFWTWGERMSGQHDDYNYYNEIDVNENPGESPSLIQQNAYTNLKLSDISKTRQHLSVVNSNGNPDSIMGKTSCFGVEVLPYEIVWYINGRVSSHLVYADSSATTNSFSMFTCSDILKMRPMHIILSFNFTPDTINNAVPSPYEDFTVEYFRCYKMERGGQDTYHPSVFTPSSESCKVYPNVILGGSGCTATVNTSTAVWAEQSIILDEGFTLTAGNTFSARIIKHGTENPATSPLYIGNYYY